MTKKNTYTISIFSESTTWGHFEKTDFEVMGDELVMVVEANNAIEAIDDYCTTRIGKIVIGRKTGMFAIKLPSGRSMLKERF